MEIQASPEPIEIKQSSSRMFWATIRSALLAVLLAFLCVFGFILGMGPGSGPLIGFLLLGVFFVIGLGLNTLMLAWRLLTVSGPVITLSMQGMRDTRISTDFIPWNAITWTLEAPVISGRPTRKPTILTMVIDETIDKQLEKTQKGGLEEIFSRFKGLKGYEFTSRGLKMELEELLEHICAFSKAANVGEDRYKVLKFRKSGL
jgi:hypothetical protein